MKIIGGKYKGIQLQAYRKGVRPSLAKLREALFNLCQAKIQDAYFLDLYAGSGAIGIEALSRGAKHVVFVDQNRNALKALQSNLLKLKLENQAQVFWGDAAKIIQKLKNESILFDFVYLDPPYSIAEVVLKKILPSIASSKLLNAGAWIFLEKAYSKQPLFLEKTDLTLVKSRKYANSHLHQFLYTV